MARNHSGDWGCRPAGRCVEDEEGAVPGDGGDLANGLEPAERPNEATSGGAAAGAGVDRRRAVAEFARN